MPHRPIPAKMGGLPSRTPGAAQAAQLVAEGAGLQRGGNLTQAEVCYRMALKANPRSADAHNLLGTVLVLGGRADEAVGHHRKAVKLQPKQANYLSNLGAALAADGEHAEALPYYRKALALKPDFVEALHNAGKSYKTLGRSTEAVEALEAALVLEPGSARARLELAQTLIDAGDMERATKILREMIAAGESVVGALIALASGRKFTPDDPEPTMMAELLDGPIVTDGQRSALSIAAGKAQADLKNYDAAFGYYSTAKQITGKAFDFDRLRRQHDALMETLTPEFFAT
ncbi:MAG TPA: tetratricopeptide repeat protein, partial [Devosiaceae bacterium]|nr:tetratricopeptide repeat protein [Devosiaceae bacterium]